MTKNIRTILFIVIGIVSVALSIKCFSFDELNYVSQSMYGGDAFTGIQNAGAQTANNIRDFATIVQFGFGSILLISGLALLAIGLTSPFVRKGNSDEIVQGEEEINYEDSSVSADDNAQGNSTEYVESDNENQQ